MHVSIGEFGAGAFPRIACPLPVTRIPDFDVRVSMVPHTVHCHTEFVDQLSGHGHLSERRHGIYLQNGFGHAGHWQRVTTFT